MAILLSRGRWLCSARTMYRILAEEGELLDRRRQRRHPEYKRPELMATAPNHPVRGRIPPAAAYDSRNRDTASYPVIVEDWPALRAAFACWLDPANFDASSRQRRDLASLQAAMPA